MKLLKSLFLIFLFLILCFSLFHIQTSRNISSGAYFLTMIALVIFVLCFLLLALKIKVGGQYLQLEQDLEEIQVEQRKLSKIVTSLYKLHIISIAYTRYDNSNKSVLKFVPKIKDEIEDLIDFEDIDSFLKEIKKWYLHLILFIGFLLY